MIQLEISRWVRSHFFVVFFCSGIIRFFTHIHQRQSFSSCIYIDNSEFLTLCDVV
ncbi:hypothetical protein HanRHA438_Chr14g0659851 [Helianthus annuus]|nr:hypothetical protein HanIR_Chr14g0704261 [Helianthus annuus]KAJ0840769.1 hypothetical protein HanPSC8_Chr14g0622791 [Helianthus annuus]KAJ0854186.1 hypothetical protein HanRHA438_Chr14g0659851 [Helianthus annuus]